MSKPEKEEYDKYDDPFYIPENDKESSIIAKKIVKLAKKWGARVNYNPNDKE